MQRNSSKAATYVLILVIDCKEGMQYLNSDQDNNSLGMKE